MGPEEPSLIAPPRTPYPSNKAVPASPQPRRTTPSHPLIAPFTIATKDSPFRGLVSQRDTVYQPRAPLWVPPSPISGVLKERRIPPHRKGRAASKSPVSSRPRRALSHCPSTHSAPRNKAVPGLAAAPANHPQPPSHRPIHLCPCPNGTPYTSPEHRSGSPTTAPINSPAPQSQRDCVPEPRVGLRHAGLPWVPPQTNHQPHRGCVSAAIVRRAAILPSLVLPNIHAPEPERVDALTPWTPPCTAHNRRRLTRTPYRPPHPHKRRLSTNHSNPPAATISTPMMLRGIDTPRCSLPVAVRVPSRDIGTG
jgi:hypothetical protein